MNGQNLNPAWWHQQAPSIAPLEAVRVGAECLERGCVVPPGAATLIAKALRLYLEGQTDITGNLGLRPRRGGRHEAPLAVERKSRRDAGIRQIYELQSGGKTERAHKVAALLQSPPEHPLSADGRVCEEDVFRHLMELHREFGGDLPTSMRQVLRVVNSGPSEPSEPSGG